MKRCRFIAGFIILLAFDTLGQIGFKLTAEGTAPVLPTPEFIGRLLGEPWMLAVVVAYAGAFLTYMSLLKSVPVGPLFAASHLDIVTVAAISVIVFNERMNVIQIVGCVVILVGVLLLACEEGSQQKERFHRALVRS